MYGITSNSVWPEWGTEKATMGHMVRTLFLHTFNVRLRIWKLCEGQWGVRRVPRKGGASGEADATAGRGCSGRRTEMQRSGEQMQRYGRRELMQTLTMAVRENN